MDGGDDGPRGRRGSKRLPCMHLERNEHETSGWFWVCVGMVIAIVTVLSGRLSTNPISDDWSRHKATHEDAAWRRPLRNELKHRTSGRYSRSGQRETLL